MTTFITIIYVIVALMMVLAILLQAGKGGGLGSALGGGASQGVFGGGGGGDFMAKLTQGFAATFMICAMYLAYASAHAGSEFLEGQDTGASEMLGAEQEINYEFIGPNPQQLPTPEEGKLMQAKASALVPAQSEAPLGEQVEQVEQPEAEQPGAEQPGEPEGAASPTPEPEPGPEGGDNNPITDWGDSPDPERGDSPQSGNKSLQNPPVNDNTSAPERGNDTGSPPTTE